MTIQKTDAQLQKDIQDELRWDTRLKTSNIGVGAQGGVITLTGTVDSWAKKQAAEKAAHRVSGVLDVANDLEVRPPTLPGRTDTELAAAIRSALQWDALVPDQQIRTTVERGVVTLEGEVESWNERYDAERSIRNLSGVQSIVNRITIRPATGVPELRSAIAEALSRHVKRELRDIRLTVDDDRVSVAGRVDSWPEKQAVLGAIRGTRGVRFVEDHLSVGY